MTVKAIQKAPWRAEALAGARGSDQAIQAAFRALLPLAGLRTGQLIRALQAEGMTWPAASRAARWLKWVAREIADAPGIEAGARGQA